MGKILIIGSGKSGIAAYKLLKSKGEEAIVFDGNFELDPQDIREKLGDEKATVLVGRIDSEIEKEISMVVLSPGVPIDSELVNHFREKGVKISGEIELAYSYEEGSLLAVTGTNGKTTTTALLGKIMQDYYEQAFVVGNIGNPYTSEVAKTTKDSVTVAEISSFQLETVDRFRPKVSAILNITPDHLNRHHTLEQYTIEKEKITKNQTKDDYVVLNYEDEVLREFGKVTGATAVYFSSQRELEEGFYYKDGAICQKKDQIEKRLLSIEELKIIGMHNVENAMAAIAMADSFLVPMDHILQSVREFTAVAHRIEYVATKNGVMYYNDSKGTNVDAAIKGIKAMTKPTCLIGGGYDKGAEYDEWIEAFDGKVKLLVLIGQTREKIAECAEKHDFHDYVFADSFEEAVMICKDHAVSGDAVLLSPACASWGMFDNYEQRGDLFKEIVNRL